jgi:hypothetical protein
MTIVIEGEGYGSTRDKLRADPVIAHLTTSLRMQMHDEGMTLDDLAHPGADGAPGMGGPRHQFMLAALRAYGRFGGTVLTHIGGPAEVILELLRAAEDERLIPKQDNGTGQSEGGEQAQ